MNDDQFYRDPDNVNELKKIAMFGSEKLIAWIKNVCRPESTLDVQFVESENVRRTFNMKFGCESELPKLSMDDINAGELTVKQMDFYKWVIDGGILELCVKYG